MISSRIQKINESPSIKLSREVAELRSQGKEIIGLNVGEPDFEIPKRILEKTSEALFAGKTRYSLVAGEVELREKIVEKINKTATTEIDIHNLLVSNGSKQSLYNIFQTICNPGDEIIILSPYWVSFPESVKLAGGIPVFVDVDQSLQPDISLIKKAIGPKTKGIIVNNPNNPTGIIFKKDILIEIGKLALENNFFVISDEAYEGIVFNKDLYQSFSDLHPDFFDWTITAKTFSKTYGMTGYRIGYTIAKKDIINSMSNLQGHLHGNNCTFGQYGAIEALNTSDREAEEMTSIFKKRRDFSFSKISKVLPCELPEGAFYLFPNVTSILKKNESCLELCAEILREKNVAILPGSAFGKEGYVRIAFTTDQKSLETGINRICEFILNRKK